MAIGRGECCSSKRKMFGRGSFSEADNEGLPASKLVFEDDSDELDEHEDELASSDDDCEITLGAEYSSSWLMPFGSDSLASVREITVPVIISWAEDFSCLKEVVMRSSAKR